MVNKSKQEKLYSVPEAAEVLGVSHDTVARWCKRGDVFPNVVISNPFAGRTRYMVPERDLLAVKARMNEPVFT